MNELAMNGDDPLRMARQQLGLVRQTVHTIERILDNAEETDRRLTRIERESNLRHGHWTVAGWIAHHDRRASTDAMKDEGMILRGICLSIRFAIPAEKVSNGGAHTARQWPIEAIRLWWPGCCARHGWQLTWKA